MKNQDYINIYNFNGHPFRLFSLFYFKLYWNQFILYL